MQLKLKQLSQSLIQIYLSILRNYAESFHKHKSYAKTEREFCLLEIGNILVIGLPQLG